MNDSDSGFDGTLEMENRALQQSQVRSINDSMRKVRRISRESQKFARTPVVDGAGLYLESTGSIECVSSGVAEDDTGCIPEPSVSALVTKALNRAFSLIERELKTFKASKNSPVVKRWKII
jgi:hypothetical protein